MKLCKSVGQRLLSLFYHFPFAKFFYFLHSHALSVCFRTTQSAVSETGGTLVSSIAATTSAGGSGQQSTSLATTSAVGPATTPAPTPPSPQSTMPTTQTLSVCATFNSCSQCVSSAQQVGKNHIFFPKGLDSILFF